MQKNEVVPLPYTINMKSKCLKNLYLKAKTTKILEDNGENLNDVEFGNDFKDMTPKLQAIKENIDKWHLIKIKDFCAISVIAGSPTGS